jgi:hypothetical protein
MFTDELYKIVLPKIVIEKLALLLCIQEVLD